MSDELGTTVTEIKQNAQRLGLLTLLRPGTAQQEAGPDDGDLSVLVDGDEAPIDVMHLNGTLPYIGGGQRVMVLFVEPHGAYAVDSISAPPSITVSPTSGPDATAVTIVGIGWEPGGYIEFFWDISEGGPPAFCAGNADSSGRVEASACSVPAGTTAGPHQVVARQGIRQAYATFVIIGGGPGPGTPTLFVDPSSGPAPSNTSYTGAGWAPGAGSVSVDWDTPATHLADNSVDAMGNIVPSSTTVPAGAAVGNHTVTATQGASSAQTIFHVTTGGGSTDPLSGHDSCWVDVPTSPHWAWYVHPSSRIGVDLAFAIAQDVMNWLGPRVCAPWQRPSPTWDFYGSDPFPSDSWSIGFWGDNDVYGQSLCGNLCTDCGGCHANPGTPEAFVFTGHAGQYMGEDSIRFIASHEAAEMMVSPLDPSCSGLGNFGAWIATNTALAGPNNCYVVEVGDVTEAGPGPTSYMDPDFGNNVFCIPAWPAWFTAGAPGPYDPIGSLPAPFDDGSGPGQSTPVGPGPC